MIAEEPPNPPLRMRNPLRLKDPTWLTDPAAHVKIESLDLSQVTPGFYTGRQLAQIYGFPRPCRRHPLLAIISVGGGIRESDAIIYWTTTGVSPLPKLIIVDLPGAEPLEPHNPPTVFDLENALDVQIAGSACPGATIVLYRTSDTLENTTNALKVATTNKEFPAHVISNSWGSDEIPFFNFDRDNFRKTHQILRRAACRGINLCFSTGDTATFDGLNVSYPASDPFSVACGGTTLNNISGRYDKNTQETAWSFHDDIKSALYGSGTGGGLSFHFKKPKYQIRVLPNVNRRALPDVALEADPETGVVIFFSPLGFIPHIGGTSLSTPLVAGFLAATGVKKFVNPLWYRLRSSPAWRRQNKPFHDITQGTSGFFRAKRGYDLCTGLGSFKGKILSRFLRKGWGRGRRRKGLRV